MNRERIVWAFLLALAFVGASWVAPTATRADFCGGTMTITPSHGPVGTRFRIEFSVGGASTVQFIHRGVEVRSVDKGESEVMHFVAEAGDEGRWRVRAAIRDFPSCYGEDRFRVDGRVSSPTPTPELTPQPSEATPSSSPGASDQPTTDPASAPPSPTTPAVAESPVAAAPSGAPSVDTVSTTDNRPALATAMAVGAVVIVFLVGSRWMRAKRP